MKITGLPGRKNMVLVFDPDEIEKVSFYTRRLLLNRHDYTSTREVVRK
jgi:hypothetical protein